MFSSSKYFLIALEATLSMRLNSSLKPLFVKYMMFSLKFAIVYSHFNFLTGVAMISLYDQSYSTKMALFPYIDLMGDFTVKST